MTDITHILQAVITLAVAVLTTFLIPWIKRKIGLDNMDEFLCWVEIGVAAAEQIFTSDQYKEKKNYVVKFLLEKGYQMEESDIENAIESAVLKLHKELYGEERMVTDGAV